MTDQAKPTVTYWHLWADADGVSHQKSCRSAGSASGTKIPNHNGSSHLQDAGPSRPWTAPERSSVRATFLSAEIKTARRSVVIKGTVRPR